MRTFPILVVLALLSVSVPATAEWGAYGADGWPVNVDGETTRPEGMPAFAVDGHGHHHQEDAGPLNVIAGNTVYPYWPLLSAELQRLAAEHPDLVRLHSAGKSTAGLDLWMLEIADFERIEQGHGIPLEQREVVWLDGGTHSNEYSGVYFVAHVASFLLDEYGTNETADWIVENRHTWIMPMVNPDGSHAFGRLNAKGVNINRNYPVIWDGSGHDLVLNNRGPAPASEVETRINIEWFNKTRPDYYASVHCCGNMWLHPYGEEGLDPVDKAMFSTLCDEAFPTVRVKCGPIWDVIYAASGSSVDTAYEYTGAVAFGYEMSGRGAKTLWGQPITQESVRVQEVESWLGVLHAFQNVHRYGAYPVVEAVEETAGGIVVTLRNIGYGNLTAGQVRLGGDTVGLPEIARGTAARVVLLGPFEEGEAALEVTYTKRLQAGPQGLVTSRVLFTSDGGVAALDGMHVVHLPKTLAEESASGGLVVPALALVGLALLVALRRR